MNFDEVIKLLDNGFTKEEIMLLNSGSKVEPEPKPEPEPEPEPKPEPEPEPKPKPEPPADPYAARYDELLAAVEKLTGAVQAVNIKRSENKEESALTPEQILAEVLTPKAKGGKK